MMTYAICPECDEPLTGVAQQHPECCDHRNVEMGDARNDPWYCLDCAHFVIPEENEDGGIDFDVDYDQN